MAKKITLLIPPLNIYRKETIGVDAYAPSEKSRWAAHKAPGAKSWSLYHRQSGGNVSSLLHSKGASRAYVLSVAAAFDAHTEIDFSAFDKLEPVTMETTKAALFSSDNRPSVDTTEALRQIAYDLYA